VNLKQEIQNLEINLPKDFFYKIQTYKEQLFKWNKIHNLTGAKDEKTVDAFIVDALYPLTFIKTPKTLLDIGTGAGFPGLILAMALDETTIHLAEPLTKRASFLQFIKASLKLDNVTIFRKKAQELDNFCYDMITSRAVSDTKLLLEISKNLRDKNTTMLFYKGERVFDEISGDIPYRVIKTNNRHYLLMGENIND